MTITLEQLKSIIANEMNLDPTLLTETSILRRFGLNSVTFISIIGELENLVQKDLDPSLFADCETVADMLNTVNHS